MGSDLVLSICNTYVGLYKVLWETSTYNITPNMLKKSVKVTHSDKMWPFRGFSGPNSTSRTSYGSDLVLSVRHPCAGQYEMFWVTSRYIITPKILKKSAKVTDSGQEGLFRRVFWT